MGLNRLKLAFHFVTRAEDVREAIRGLKSKAPYTRDISIATTFGVGKAMINAVAWIGTSETRSYAAIAAAVTGWGLDVWFARNAQRWVNWKKSSFLTWNRFGFGIIARWINQSEARRVFLIDQLNGLFWNLYFRTLAFLDKPHATNPVFSTGALHDFWLPIVTGMITEAPIAAASQVSINNLRQKGVVGSRWQFYTFLLFDLSFSAKSFMMQRGYSFLYWPMFFTEMFVRLGLIAKNVITPATETKIVILDPEIQKNSEVLKNILHQEGIVLPEDPVKGILDSDFVMQDWETRSAHRHHLSANKRESLIHSFEQQVESTYRLLVFASTQRATGIDYLGIQRSLERSQRKIQESLRDFQKACSTIYRK